jgi:hypothetical protein
MVYHHTVKGIKHAVWEAQFNQLENGDSSADASE